MNKLRVTLEGGEQVVFDTDCKSKKAAFSMFVESLPHLNLEHDLTDVKSVELILNGDASGKDA